MLTKKASLTLGPIYYLWKPEKWRDFYFRIADESPIDCVSIGETICSKRIHFNEKLVDEVITRLQGAGKKIYYSTLALVTLDRERKLIQQIIKHAKSLIEANDLSTIGLLDGQEYTIGPLINVYNAATARFFANRGAKSICLPPELPFSSIHAIAKEVRDRVPIEVFSFGRLPLAISARCAHARAKGFVKDNCQFVCGEEPNGLAIRTLDGKDFLNLNGVQTLSYSCQVLSDAIEELIAAGVSRFRLSPQDCDMVEVAKVFSARIAGTLSGDEATHRLKTICKDMPLSNGFLHGVEGARWVERPLA